ncbi:MAG: ABC transporter substrate-binding protein, partial [Candidatus Limnocylindrales bacterium]
MTRRDNAVVAVLVLVLVVLAGALAIPSSLPAAAVVEPTSAPTLPPPITYREGVVGIPASITPLTARTRAEKTLVGLVFSGLMRMGPDRVLQPDLAESWSVSADGMTFTFVIRADATWSDGTPVTSADVVYTVDALKSPDSGGAAAASWAEVTVSAIDERTVTFALATPVGGFLAATTQPLLPAHLLGGVPFADLATSDFAHNPVGTGAFALTQLDDTRAVLLPSALLETPFETPTAPFASPDSLATPVPQATPGRPMPWIERIEVRFYPDDAAVVAALQAGDIDAAAGLGPDAASTAGAIAGVDRMRYPTTTLATALLNLRPGHPELRDPRVRTALLAGLDRDSLVSDVLGGDAVRADALVPPNSWAYDVAAAGTVNHDVKAAAKLLTAAGWKKVDGAWAAPKATA